MRTLLPLLLPLAVAAADRPVAGTLYAIGSGKTLSSDDWDPVDRMIELGVGVDLGPRDAPVRGMLEVLHAWRDENTSETFDDGNGPVTVTGTVEGSTTEFRLGAKYLHEWERIGIWVGGGLAVIRATVKLTATDGITSASAEDDDTGVGGFLEAAVYAKISRQFRLGALVSWSRADTDLVIEGETSGVDAGGWHYGVLAGIAW